MRFLAGFPVLVASFLVVFASPGSGAQPIENQLCEAVKWGDAARVTDLLKEGADINASDSEGITPLIWACAGRRKDIVALLLSRGADVNRRARLGHTALGAAAGSCDVDLVNILVDAGADVNARSDYGSSILAGPAVRGCTKIVELLLDRGADLRPGKTGEETVLMAACNYGRTETAALLLDRGSDPNARSLTGQAALMAAAYRGRADVVRLLLNRGADVAARDRFGWTALTLASLTGYLDVARELLDKGTDINSCNEEGKTALMIASSRGNTELVKLLLERGANASLRDKNGRTAMIYAPNRAQTNVSEALTTEPDVVVVERPIKIAQLVGEYDRDLKRPTANRTLSRYKLIATDLGVPFVHRGRTYILFGDTDGTRAGDAIAYTTDTNPEKGLNLEFIHDGAGEYKPIKIPGISQKDFEVPVAGISIGGRMYIYHTTDHSKDTIMGRCVIAVSDDDGLTFRYLYDFSTSHFINLSVDQVDLSNWKGFPDREGQGLVFFGSGPFRKSDVRLAYQPSARIEDRSAIRYFAGLNEKQEPRWSPYEEEAQPLFNQPCVGELSVSFNRFLKKWIMLYNCGTENQAITMRTADHPWGPWSEPQAIFEPSTDQALCRYMHASWLSQKCDIVHDPGTENATGVCYGPFQFGEMAVGDDSGTTIYFTLSTWNPYTVLLMKTRLQRIPR